ncbi:MAG: hypothetical protein V3R51_01190 [Gammaproteobacteria bacterium]
MIVETTDPITGNDVKDIDHAPYIVDGELKIYFESEESKQAYLDIEVENPAEDLSAGLDNPAGMGPGDVRH